MTDFRGEEIHAFPNGVILKVNVIVRPEFELALYDVADQFVNHYTTGFSSNFY